MVRRERGRGFYPAWALFSLRRGFKAPRHRATFSPLRVESETEKGIEAQDCERSRRTE